MTTFNIFLFCIVTPILIGIVILMIIIAKKASKFEAISDKHLKTEDERFEFKKQELKGIDNKVESLSDIISSKVINPLAEVNNRINLLGVDANMDNLMKSFNELDISFSQIGDNALYFGTELDDLTITFIIRLDIERQLLYFQAFSGAFDKITPTIYEHINEFNSRNMVGSLELRSFSDKFIPTLNYALLFHDNKLSRNNILEVIRYIGFAMQELFSEKIIIELSFFSISFKDYLKLSLGEEKYKELTSEEDGQTE
jgi:hypothetical protein